MARFHFTELERLRILESEDAPGTAEVIVNERRRKDQDAVCTKLERIRAVTFQHDLTPDEALRKIVGILNEPPP